MNSSVGAGAVADAEANDKPEAEAATFKFIIGFVQDVMARKQDKEERELKAIAALDGDGDTSWFQTYVKKGAHTKCSPIGDCCVRVRVVTYMYVHAVDLACSLVVQPRRSNGRSSFPLKKSSSRSSSSRSSCSGTTWISSRRASTACKVRQCWRACCDCMLWGSRGSKWARALGCAGCYVGASNGGDFAFLVGLQKILRRGIVRRWRPRPGA
jgi:hypothetical protein